MSVTQIIDLQLGDPEWEKALPVLQTLRPNLTRAQLDQVITEGAPQGLRFTAYFEGAECRGVAAWRVEACTSALRRFYIDDLATAEDARSRGYGKKLLRSLVARARELRCNTIELHTSVGRHATHRFLIRERMDITAHHFRMALD